MEVNKNKSELRGLVNCSILLLAALMLIFRQDLFSGGDLFFRIFRDPNPIFGFYPWSRFSMLCWEAGMFPLWSPYTLLGTPFLAHYQTSVFSVLSYPLLIGSFEKTVVPYLLARLLVAGAGAYLVARRFGASRGGRILASICFGLTGYLVQYVNDIHVVIDLLIPFLVLFGDRLVCERRVSDFLLTILVTVLVLLGGQPSAAFFTLALGYGYMVFMCASRKEIKKGLVFSAGAMSLSLLISLPQVLAFLEYLPRAWTFHGPGFGKAGLSITGMVTWIAPGFLGPLSRASQEIPHIMIAPYMGAVPVVLALCALLRPSTKRDVFLSIVAILCVAIMAGVPPLSYLAAIPGPDRLTHIKYLQPLLAFAIAVLAAKGLDRALQGETRILLPASIVLAATVGLAWLLMGPLYPAFFSFMAGAFLIVLVFLAVLSLCFLLNARIIKNSRYKRAGRAAVFCTVALVWIELVAASAVNHAHMFRDLAEHDFEKYKRIADEHPLSRMSVRPEVFYANAGLIPPVFDLGISDVVFVKESKKLFVAAAGYDRQEFLREFMRYHSFELPFRPGRPGLARMMGVRYYLSRSALPPNRSIDHILGKAKITAPDADHYGRGAVALHEDYRKAIFAHPPCCISIPVFQKENHARLAFKSLAGIDPDIATRPGDGAWFAAVVSRAGKPALPWSRYLDPRKKKSERQWKAFIAEHPEISRLSLVTLPAGSNLNDWAYWGDPRTGGDFAVEPDRIFRGIKVYEDNKAYPRLFLAERVVRVKSEKDVIPALDRIGYDTKAAVLKEDDIEVGKLDDPSGGTVHVQSYGVQRIKCKADSEGRSLLVLADAYYPGWRVFVDGVERQILKVNLGLRGVVVPPGESEIEFVYQPVSFQTGLWSAVAALGGIAAFVSLFWKRRNRHAG